MSNLSKRFIILFTIFLILASCVKTIQPLKLEAAIQTAHKYLVEGDFQKAIEIYNSASAKNLNNKELYNSYLKAIEYIKENADRAFNSEIFASAGYTYYILLINYPHFTNFVHLLPFDQYFLDNRIKTCSKNLAAKGLIAYREGKFEEAIYIWKDILRFDPENEEIKKSIDTATTQLKNFQKK
ncbi:MAG: hypothetical protein AB1610_11505 [Nitrospirota bacterium]